ncbi:hypothetical protein D3C72_244890 [compost metagenome]
MQGKLLQVKKALQELEGILNEPQSPMTAMIDLDVWRCRKLAESLYLLDEAINEADPDHPDQQRKLNHELEAAVQWH